MIPDSSQSPQFPDGADLLDRATQALRQSAHAHGPSPMLIARTQEALRSASLAGPNRRLFLPRSAVWRMAASVAIVCGVAVAYWAVRHAGHRIAPPSDPRDLVRKTNPAQSAKDSQAPVVPPPHTPAVAHDDRSPAPAHPAVALADGVISGRILFDGALPSPMRLAAADHADCTKAHGEPLFDESLVVDASNSLANVVVSVSDGLGGWLQEEFPPPTQPAVLDQKGCVFRPHVVAVMVGQQLLIKNSDPFLHNVRLMAVNNPPANLGQPSEAEAQAGPFRSPEVFRVKCDVHPWMEAWVRVVDNPYFCVTGADGRFTIRGLPPGTYTVKAWHEQLGVKEQQVTISPGHGSAADFILRAN